MRMEELSDSRYIKTTDTVEKYLLNLVEQYFTTHSIASTTSREYIIKKAIERMKEELSYDDIGVLSITLPSGEIRTGAISITLADLHGEPLIAPKLSAFNVAFGNEQNTACEGNDPRLFDARAPLDHNHAIEDIVGLEGKLSTIIGKVNRINGLSHSHSNKQVLDMLVYSGDKTIIDLDIIDSLEKKINLIIEQIRSEIIEYKSIINQKVETINSEIINIQNQLNVIRALIVSKNEEYLAQAKEYTNSEIAKIRLYIQQITAGYLTRDDVDELVNIAQKSYTLVGSMRFTVSSAINTSSTLTEQIKEINISQEIITELAARNVNLVNCQIEALIEYQSNGSIVYGVLPYIILSNNGIDGSIQLGTIYSEEKMVFKFTTTSGVVPLEIKSASIIYNVYSTQEFTL